MNAFNIVIKIRMKPNFQIPFNRCTFNDNALKNIQMALSAGYISGNGNFTAQCHSYLNQYYSTKTLFTHSGTAALEMAALLCNIQPGDEVIVPSFTFVSTANALLLRGAKIIFADTEEKYPNLDIESLEELITEKTKVIVPVHYAGVACNMNALMTLVNKNNINIIEDAAQAIGSHYNGKLLGTFGRFGAISFHETKNITAGEGGLLIINNKTDFKRAEIIWEKGTNRADLHRGVINKYEWIEVGSSFLPSDINAAILYSQLNQFDFIQNKRIAIWNKYFAELQPLQEKGVLRLPQVPKYGELNGHMFFIECESKKMRDGLISFLGKKGILAVFHYLPLHLSPYFKNKHDGRILNNSVKFSERIVRLPLFLGLKEKEQDYIIEMVKAYF